MKVALLKTNYDLNPKYVDQVPLVLLRKEIERHILNTVILCLRQFLFQFWLEYTPSI